MKSVEQIHKNIPRFHIFLQFLYFGPKIIHTQALYSFRFHIVPFPLHESNSRHLFRATPKTSPTSITHSTVSYRTTSFHIIPQTCRANDPIDPRRDSIIRLLGSPGGIRCLCMYWITCPGISSKTCTGRLITTLTSLIQGEINIPITLKSSNVSLKGRCLPHPHPAIHVLQYSDDR